MWPGRRRRFRRGMLKYVILKMLEAGERHGYDLIRHFEERGWGRLGAGSLYPLLSALEEHGLIEGRDEDGRRRYRITDLGRKRLHDVADELSEAFEQHEHAPGAPRAEDPLREAMQKLASAVQQAAQHAKPESRAYVAERIDALRKEIYTILANE